MNRRVMMENAKKTLEAKIRISYLKASGWSKEECHWKEFLRENRDDYLEYREWYLTCYA